MDKNYEELYHDEEETNWWFVARRDMIKKMLHKFKVSKDAKILDIGCASGVLLSQLKELGFQNLYALDYSPEAIAICKKKGLVNSFVMDGHEPEFENDFFDVIIASDSLEHLENDMMALKNWHNILKSNGLAFIFVPAYNFLWSSHDEINYHFRRYTKSNLASKVKSVNFKVETSGYWNVSVFLPTAAIRLLGKVASSKNSSESQDSHGDIKILPTAINSMLINFMKLENSILKYIRMPFGVSTYVVITK